MCTLHNYDSSALLPEDSFPRVDFLVLKTLLNLEKIMSRINHISNKRLHGRIRKERKLHSKIQIFNLTNTTCQQPCQIKTHLSLVHSHFPLRLSSFSARSTFIRSFASLSRMSVSKYIYILSLVLQILSKLQESTIEKAIRRVYFVGNIVFTTWPAICTAKALCRSPTRCVTSAEWARVLVSGYHE